MADLTEKNSNRLDTTVYSSSASDENLSLLASGEGDHSGYHNIDLASPLDTSKPFSRSLNGPRAFVLCARLCFFGIGIFLILLGLFTGYSTWLHYNESAGINPSDHPVSSDRYTLDPTWDFQAAPTRREFHWTIEDLQHNPDGVFRPMILINKQFPGPLIQCNEGDTVSVRVSNKAANATSIHWHGLFQRGTPWMDGAAGITQCPIAPGAELTYEFTTKGQSGTYFYHAHYGAQTADGLVGPLVIHSKEERTLQRIPYATDRVVMVQDHYYDLSGALAMQYLKPGMDNDEPIPDTALINGMNTRDCGDVLQGRRCDNSTSRPFTIDLEPGKNHRLRIINAGAFANFNIQVDQHDFAVTEVDGTDVLPAYYNSMSISPAQRYSVVLTSNQTNSTAFWMRAKMDTDMFTGNKKGKLSEARAVVRYADAGTKPTMPASTFDTTEHPLRFMNTSELRPSLAISAPASVDDTVVLRASFRTGAWRLSRGSFNQSSWRPSITSPSLHRFIDGYNSGNTSFRSSLSTVTGVNSMAFSSKHELVYQTTQTRTIDILINNFDDGEHPLHLHGHKFWVLASGDGYPTPGLVSTLDLSNPLRRDTVTVGAYGWVLLRFTADNPGMWAFHCHNGWHSEAGMLMQFLTRADEVVKYKLPEPHRRLCKMSGMEKGKTPDDKIWYGKFTDD